jgi:uncharacterized protein (DUF1501 family)
VNSTTDGWLNRYLQATPEAESSPFRAVAASLDLPLTLQGPASALAVQNLAGFRLHVNERNPHLAGLADAFQSVYASTSDPLLRTTAQETFSAIKTLQRIQSQPYQPEGSAIYPKGPFGNHLQEVAQLIKSDLGLELAFVDIGGWDHHVNEGSVRGRLGYLLKDFGESLAAFYQDLGDHMGDVVVLTMSEFGRTARENGNRGTDHGHANVMFVMGGPVKGGKIYGRWPGLKPHQLNQDRDLALTTDFRDVFAEAVARHLGNPHASSIFPGFTSSPNRFLEYLA